MIKELLIVIICLISLSVFGQSDMAKAMIDMDSRITTYDISKIDTQFYESNEIQKLFYYDTDNKLRKTSTFYISGKIKGILNRDQEDRLDGLTLSIYESGSLKSYGMYNKGIGFSYQYYEDGRIKIYSQSKDTYLCGYRVSFCSEGELYSETFYDSTGYTETGYYCNGNLRIRGRNKTDYINKVGKWEYWNEEGKLIKIEHWEEGKLIKEEEIETSK